MCTFECVRGDIYEHESLCEHSSSGVYMWTFVNMCMCVMWGVYICERQILLPSLSR